MSNFLEKTELSKIQLPDKIKNIKDLEKKEYFGCYFTKFNYCKKVKKIVSNTISSKLNNIINNWKYLIVEQRIMYGKKWTSETITYYDYIIIIYEIFKDKLNIIKAYKNFNEIIPINKNKKPITLEYLCNNVLRDFDKLYIINKDFTENPNMNSNIIKNIGFDIKNINKYLEIDNIYSIVGSKFDINIIDYKEEVIKKMSECNIKKINKKSIKLEELVPYWNFCIICATEYGKYNIIIFKRSEKGNLDLIKMYEGEPRNNKTKNTKLITMPYEGINNRIKENRSLSDWLRGVVENIYIL